MIQILILLCLVSMSVGVTYPNYCDDSMPAMTNFDITKIGGSWFVTHSYYRTSSENLEGCITGSIAIENDIKFKSEGLNNKSHFSVEGAAAIPDKGLAKFDILFKGSEATTTFWILDTDYKNYALIYTCRNVPPMYRNVESWILSRHPYLSATSFKPLDKAISLSNILFWGYFQGVEHSEDACNSVSVTKVSFTLLTLFILMNLKQLLTLI